MATEGTMLLDGDRVAGADLSAETNQYCAVTLDGNSAVVLCGAGVAAYGILQNRPALGEPALVCIYGRTKMRAGAAIATPMTQLTPDADGELVAVSATTNFVAGRNITAAGGDNEIFDGLFTQEGQRQTT